jgi:hypothetical protein
MITQMIRMKAFGPCEHAETGECTEHRIVGEVCPDKIFWAYAETKVDGEWIRDDGIVSYQRDSIAVPFMQYDPDVTLYFANQGLVSVDNKMTDAEWHALLKRLQFDNRVDGECEICHNAYPANCTCPSDVDCPNCLAGSLCIFH